MTRKFKVIHIITKLELGGAQKVALMTLERLTEMGYETGLISGSQGLLIEEAEAIRGLDCRWIPSLVREIRPLKDAAAFWAIYRVLRRERPEIVHTHSSKAGILGRWAAWLAGVPHIFHTAHGFAFNEYQNPVIHAVYVWLEKISAWVTTQAVVVSLANASRAEDLGILTPGEWILCRAGIQVDDFTQPVERRTSLAKWGIPEDRVVVGMVACFKPQKSPLDFVDVASRVLSNAHNAHFVMAGDGELRPEIEARIQEAGIGDRFTLLGWQHDMPEVYRNLDIFVLTSLWEGQPCVFAEAMASGLPIVATEADGAREAITDGETGFVCPPRDIRALSRAVSDLISDPALQASMGVQARAHASEFDIGASVSRLEAAYRACLDDGYTPAAVPDVG